MVDYYENATVLHMASLGCLVPNVWYYWRYVQVRKDLFASVKPVLMRVVFWTTLALNTYFACHYYDKFKKPTLEEGIINEKYRREVRHQ